MYERPWYSSTSPGDPDYRALVEAGFADWRLVIDGLVERPLSLSLAELRALGARSVPIVSRGTEYTLCQSMGDVV